MSDDFFTRSQRQEVRAKAAGRAEAAKKLLLEIQIDLEGVKCNREARSLRGISGRLEDWQRKVQR